MRIMIVVEWRYNYAWEFAAAFLEPKEAESYAFELQSEFPADDIRLVKRKIFVDEDVIEVISVKEAKQ